MLIVELLHGLFTLYGHPTAAICPSSTILLLPSGSQGCLASIPTTALWVEAGHILGKSALYCGTTWRDKQPYALSVTQLQICLACPSLTPVLYDSLKKSSQHRRGEHASSTQKKAPGQGFQLAAFLLNGNANHCTTMAPHCSHANFKLTSQ